VSEEPQATALLLAVVGTLFAVSVLVSRAASRFTVPVALLYLAVGVIATATGIPFNDHALAFRLGTISLVLILFDGGLNTSLSAVKPALTPSVVLATAGVAGTAAIVGAAAHLLGMDWRSALLLGAVVSSTDAAAVFAVLRGSRVELRRRVATTLELESGLNDPLAVMLTIALTAAELPHWWMLPRELAIGFVVGWLVGQGGRRALPRLGLTTQGLVPVFTVALAFVAFGAAGLLGGSGFLATYVTAVVLGNAKIPYRAGLARVHDALAWLSQVLMFVVLGLLSTPERLLPVAPMGVAIALVLAFVARPISVLLCLLPFRYSLGERGFVAWVGLRGAVPIVLATFPVLRGVPDAAHIFDIVFFVVLLNAILPGATVRWAARRFGVQVKAPPPPRALVEITSTESLNGEVLSFYIEPASAVANVRIADLPLPEGATVTLVTRGTELVAPRGNTVMNPGDHVHVFCHPEDKALVLLLFGRQEEE
jgi:cell volume regulation protein A